jgi:murein DD-endopeptidase MepM/ murein hydrolase activator NlpD
MRVTPLLMIGALLVAALPAAVITDKLPGARPTRPELIGSETHVSDRDEPSTDPAARTPLPIERPEDAAYLPDGMALEIPFSGEHRISNGYGYQSGGWTHRTIGNEQSANDFFAIDIGMPIGTPILATAAGRIVTSNLRDDSYGNYIVIDHGQGVTSVYAHLNSLEHEVLHGSPEVHVEAGDQIGVSGETGTSGGPHLHFTVHTNARQSHSGADVGGLATVPEPLSGLYGLREGHALYGGE